MTINNPDSHIRPPTRPDLPLPVTEGEPEGSKWAKAHHVLLAFLVIALIVWLLSGIYKVNADEVAIVERLGSFVTSTDGGKAMLIEQGLHYRLPWPIDQVFKIPVQQTRTLTVDTFFAPQGEYADYKRELMREDPRWTPELMNALYDPYLITADKNVIHMSVAVTYRIEDPEAWLMAVSHDSEEATAATSTSGSINDKREELLQQIVQHAMVRQLANIPVDRVLFEGSEKIQGLLTKTVQDAVELPDPSDPTGKATIDLGIQIQRADPVSTHWPQYQMVDDAFQSVLRSKSDADSARYAAHSYADAAHNQAVAQQQTMIREAGAYQKQVTDEAQGEANRFSQVYAQYEKAPDVTRWNIFAEAAKDVSTNAKRIMFVQPGEKTILTIEPPQFDAGQAQPNK